MCAQHTPQRGSPNMPAELADACGKREMHAHPKSGHPSTCTHGTRVRAQTLFTPHTAEEEKEKTRACALRPYLNHTQQRKRRRVRAHSDPIYTTHSSGGREHACVRTQTLFTPHTAEEEEENTRACVRAPRLTLDCLRVLRTGLACTAEPHQPSLAD